MDTIFGVGKEGIIVEDLSSCPCLYTTPCKPGGPGCTCVQPFSSAGCLRCCAYGSSEQQRKMAEHLAKIIDGYHAREEGLEDPHKIFWEEPVAQARDDYQAQVEPLKRPGAPIGVSLQREPGEMSVFFFVDDAGDLIIDCGTGGRLRVSDHGGPGMEVELRKTMRGLALLRKKDPYTVTRGPNVQGRWLDRLNWAVDHYRDRN